MGNKEIGVLGGKIDKLQKENEQIAALDTKLKASQSELNKLTKQRDEEQSKYKRNLSDGSKQLQKEKEALEYKLKTSKTENEKLNGLNVKYKQGEEEAKGTMKVTKAVDNAEIKELKANVLKLEKELNALKSKHDRALKAEVGNKETDIKRIQYEKKKQGRAYDKNLCHDKMKLLTEQLEEARKGED